MHDVWLTMLSSRAPQWHGIWRPPDAGSSAAPTACSSISEGRDPEREHERAVAVVGEEPVVAGAQVTGEAEQQRLVTGARDLEERAVLLAQRDLAVVEAARHERQAEIGDGLGEEALVGALDHAHVAPFLIALCAPAAAV